MLTEFKRNDSNSDDIRKGITSKLDGSIGTLFLHFINNIAKNMIRKMKEIYCWDFLVQDQ